jgi:hypothetical protein
MKGIYWIDNLLTVGMLKLIIDLQNILRNAEIDYVEKILYLTKNKY